MVHMDINELLFSYLRQILYDPEHAALPDQAFSPAQQKLADGLRVVHSFLVEERQFCAKLSQGIITDAAVPSRENVLSAPLKEVHGMLRHLLWLMDEVRKGDYHQRLNFANDLSDSFNQMVDSLVELSLQDRLTGILNTNGFDEKVSQRLQTGIDAGKLYVLSINVNDFRHFNTLYGPERGDALLQRIAEFLQGSCQEGELCARIHADHFMCLVTAASAEDVAARFNVDKARIWPGSITSRTYLFRHGIYPVTDAGVSVRLMRSYADFAGQSIQNSNCVNYAVFNAVLRQRYELENTLLEHFQRAVQGQEFAVYYQPKVAVDTGRIVGCEALVRWVSPGRGILMPGRFIQLFEANGLITALDFYVLEAVCRKLRKALDAGHPIVPVAVNFSRVHLLDSDFVAHLRAILEKYQLEPDFIEVEITETAFFENMSSMVTMLDALHQAGFRVAMDDFGSGFSSLNLLQTLSFDVMKIDKLFFNSFEEDSNSRLLLEDILSIARHLKLKTVAEGIETQEQVDFLQEHDCDMIQGYYFYEPLSQEAFDEAIVSNRKECAQ